MIRNERQYRITKAQIDEFERKMQALSAAPPAGVHPRIVEAQRDAMQSQRDELREQLAAYESLQNGTSKVLELTSLDQLPAALIQARIAAGLTQRELAERLGMKEQQLQRYEATDYAGASLERIRSVIDALGVKIREDVFLPGADVSTKKIVQRAESAGLKKDLVMKRILPSHGENEDAAVLNAATIMNRIFGWAPAVLFGDAPLAATASPGARFKLPEGSATKATEIYTTYAHYVAGLLLRATRSLEAKPIPTDPKEVRAALVAADGELSFSAALDYVWSLGVAVLPLADKGAFHGATWRVGGRNVIVLKQGTRLESRWLHDLLHELRHAAEEPEASELAFIDYEVLAKENASTPAETWASLFAGDVVLDGRAEDLAKKCVKEAAGSIERLKAIVPEVAKRERVSVEGLANYMAFRLSLQGENWWGAAMNLQTGSVDPWQVARNQTLGRLDLTVLDDTERVILLRALEGDLP
jgi:transcriptional regulator with XRE-family HTH domain